MGMKRVLKSIRKSIKKATPVQRGVIFSVAFALLGTALLLTTRAAMDAAHFLFESESSQHSGAVATKADSNASNGVYVEFGSSNPVGTATSVNQWGITWNFDRAYPVGQFANGDWWVVGPVTIVSITPYSSSGRSGVELNPSNYVNQPYDSRIAHYDDSLVFNVPSEVSPGSSVVKSISRPNDIPVYSDGCRPCLETAAVLTVVESIPPDGGSTVFRPPYFGTEKPYYSIYDLNMDLLPSLSPVGTPPTLAETANRFARVQLDHQIGWQSRALHPEDNMPAYGGDVGRVTGESVLRLMLSDSEEDKMDAIIKYVQGGIDRYHMMKNGTYWEENGGHMNGRKISVVFAAVMLENDQMKSDIMNAPDKTFSEDQQIYFSQVANNGEGMSLWGIQCAESVYWQRITSGSGPRTCADPYGLVDGGGAEIGGAYQYCCTSKMFKSHALAQHLMPEIKEVWDHSPFLDYVDRWVNHGVWAAPDNCALTPPSSYNGNCVPGSGRWTDQHGEKADEGGYGSEFANAMWAAYR